MNNPNEDFTLKIKPRPSEIVSIKIPLDTLANLEMIAQNRNLSVESLIKFYIGKNLREDISQEFSEKLFNSTLKVLSKYISSESQREKIINEIKSQL
ncbi:hypothetical protein WEU38_05415 [Cyanobacterium aponinum AL20118]|uniref:CopG family transcriptional regulator n=2 Tax=Cyanobacterium aponinum TaxID=379064 RepID=A0A844GZY2_9CHRO|nr:hypothetical protein [Cyanobacterium aponinum]MTF40632.1 hypothetical protein [Cyanobacterium aponinum 0216]WPF89715.1 hypothetical protein SAY89_05435 [Cyanobacterium aponinum AL20115]